MNYELSPEFWAGKTVCLLGGTGSMGTAMAKELIKLPVKNIRVAGSTELSKYDFIEKTKDLEGSNKLHCKIRNMRDYDSMITYLNGCDVLINAAALKDVSSGIYDPNEVHRTNVIGNFNVREAAIKCDVDVVLFVSTDKAWNPTTYYGTTKLYAEAIYESGNYEKPANCKTKFGSTRCGNLWKSRRSVTLTWDNYYEKELKPHFKVTDPNMTRFFISVERAARYQLWCAERVTGKEGKPFIPDIYSCKLEELVKGRYPNATYEIVGAQKSEKMHEGFSDDYTSDNPKYLKGYPEILEYL
jgi:UDP-N-acetylglucosamine 4,6-dehydratase